MSRESKAGWTYPKRNCPHRAATQAAMDEAKEKYGATLEIAFLFPESNLSLDHAYYFGPLVAALRPGIILATVIARRPSGRVNTLFHAVQYGQDEDSIMSDLARGALNAIKWDARK